jgi:osmotically-inducible protein OsmY
MKTTLEKSDTEIKSDVLAELKYEPSVKVTDIGVLVKDGTVTLNGCATSYAEKWEAVRAAKRVAGVTAIADEITVKLWDSFVRTDSDIATSAANQIKWITSIPTGKVQLTVSEGWITLDGELEWYFEKDEAERTVRALAGVKGVSNLIKIKPKLSSSDIVAEIKSAFDRNSQLYDCDIEVESSGGKVTLRGTVYNYSEREEAVRVAWAAAGVLSVDDRLEIDWSDGMDD